MEAPETSEEARRGVGLARREIQLALATDQPIMCPCCDRVVQRTERSINAIMVDALRYMRDHGPVFPKDFPDRVAKQRDYPRLAHWSLAEKVEVSVGKGRTKQAWKITQAGKMFLTGDLKVPRKIWVFADEVLQRTETDLVSVHECTGKSEGAEMAPKFERRVGGMGDIGL
ncbi:hypothetical protein [Hyphomicrobium sp.]|uniref:hypothetical protein n=1 Tax=Hyphomicrobium sp. TaxID=82 RepID=UPI001E0D523A|nr:hypothetical protein [Hyphomicrobium sp.]MBY0561437.1 hypothetical protein [Hyphomicrobium sp.]